MKLFVKVTVLLIPLVSVPVLAMGDTPSKSGEKTAVVDAADYWYDGSKKRSIVMDASVIASFGKDQAPGVDVTGNIKGGVRLFDVSQSGGSKTVLRSSDDDTISPLFYDAASRGGQRRALPGGVVVRLNSSWSRDQALQWFADRNLSVINELAIKNTFVIAAPAGRASLELANSLYETGEVQMSSPNWWKEVHTR